MGGKSSLNVPAGLFIIAAGLRILLFLANPPENAFDNHFEPIRLIMQTGQIPAKTACFQCYQPPVFYALSALAGKLLIVFGINGSHLVKILQFLPCLYGIAHLGVVYLILGKVSLSPFSRVIAFAAVCFLPAHIYISAMHSNDTISYLGVAICIYLFLIALEKKMALPWLFLLSIAMAVTIFTKYTAFVVIPAVLIPSLVIVVRRIIVPARKMIISLALIFFLPLVCLALYAGSNVRNYGAALPWNTAMLNPAATQPKAEKIDFINFKLVAAIHREILHPDILDSFWTMLYSRMMFDSEPKFLYFTDPDDVWWEHYYCWLRGEEPFPGEEKKFSFLTRFTGTGLLALGIIPLFVVFFGIISIKPDAIAMQVFPVLLFCNLALVIMLTLRSPVYSSIKAVYLLNSLPAFAVLLGSGAMLFEKCRTTKLTLAGCVAVSAILATVHILHIVSSV